MLEPGNILEAKAILSAIDRQFTLPIELRLKLDAIDTKLAKDINYFNQAIRDCINLFANYPQIQADYHTAELELQADAGDRGKGFLPVPIDPITEFSGEPLNSMRVVVSEGKPPAKPVGFWGKLFGKKSTAN
jgi:hypothetical protein